MRNYPFDKEEYEKASGQDLILCVCSLCEKEFKKQKRSLRNKIKKYKNLYCSFECSCKDRVTSVLFKCSQCSKEFHRKASQIERSKNHFCSQSCSATYNNVHKTKGNRRSKLEVWLEQKLPSLCPNLEFHFNRKDAIDSELDIYIPSLKLAFELNGIFHYEPIFGEDKLESIKNNDNRKFQACLEKKIELCIIDTSKLSYFKESNAIKFLQIIQSVIERKT